MVEIKDKIQCCGCNACGDICPKGAISFPVDNEGIWYPRIDKDLCVDCGLCNKTCPVENISALKKNDLQQVRKLFCIPKEKSVFEIDTHYCEYTSEEWNSLIS